MKGSYILLVHLPKARTITVGRLGDVRFPGGYYAYVGSAMGGFRARVNRHLHRTGKPHWHIDYLRDKASVTGVILCESTQRQECAIAQALEEQLDCVPGFGASDCRCRSHLFFSRDESRMKQVIMAILDRLKLPTNLKPRKEIHRWLQPLEVTGGPNRS